MAKAFNREFQNVVLKISERRYGPADDDLELKTFKVYLIVAEF